MPLPTVGFGRGPAVTNQIVSVAEAALSAARLPSQSIKDPKGFIKEQGPGVVLQVTINQLISALSGPRPPGLSVAIREWAEEAAEEVVGEVVEEVVEEVLRVRPSLTWQQLHNQLQWQEGLWIVYRKKSSKLDDPVYDDLVEEALCFGWIDSQARRVDDDRMMQWFSPRRKGGLWSALSKTRIEELLHRGLMTEVGQAVIDEAKADGSWSQTDEVDALIVPPDLADALDAAPAARDAYQALADSAKRQFLWWIHSAKRPATRANRIEETVRRLSSGEPFGST